MDGFKLTFRIVGVLLAIIGAVAALYVAATKFISKTRYFSDDDADIIECDCYECDLDEEEELEEEVAAE